MLSVRLGFVLPLILGAYALGCGGTGTQAARSGDLPGLRASIQERHAKGTLTNPAARELGLALLEHDLKVASASDAREVIEDAVACAVDLDDALAARARLNDATAPLAAMARVESGRLDLSTVHRFKDAYLAQTDEHWRALGARSLVDADDFAARSRAMVDVSPYVRRAAFRAARDSHDERDENLLYESARLDPVPMTRTEALRSLIELGLRPRSSTRPSGRAPQLSKGFGDLYAAGDDGIREDIASTWARTPFYENGGRGSLRTLFATEHGPGVIAGAGAVVRRELSEKKEDISLRGEATSVLEKALASGTERDKLHVLATASGEVGARLAKVAATDASLVVRVAGLSREMGAADASKAVEAKLLALAGDKDHPVAADRARTVLASAKVKAIQAWLEADLKSESAGRKITAARGLSAMGRSARAAPLLTDPDARVRHRVACILIRGDS